jgi:lipopolysaccharide export system protein LptA
VLRKPLFLIAQAVLALASLAAGGQVLAASADSRAPITVDADSLHYDDLKQTSVFTGHVVLTKGTLVLKSDHLELREDAEGYQFGVATANPGRLVEVHQRREGTDETMEGVAERVEFDGRNQLLHFISKAVVRRMACGEMVDEVRGQKVTYNQRTDTYTASGGPESSTSGRVRTIIQPKSQGDAAPTGCGPAQAKAKDKP